MPTLILPSGRVDGHLAQRGHETTGLATRGTDGSNPPPSSGESIANPTFSIRTNPVSGFAVDCRLVLALEGSRGRVQHWRRCRGPPSDGVAGAGRGGRDRGCRGGDSHGAGDGYPQAILPAAGNARPARRYSWHTRQMSDRMQCLEIAITPGGNDGQGSRCRIFSLARRVWRRSRTKHRKSPGQARNGAARMGLWHEDLP